MSFVFKKPQNILKIARNPFNQQIFRYLNLQEHVAQTILNEHGIKTPQFGLAKTSQEAENIAKSLMTRNLVVKAQVLTGGRGLGKFKNGFKGGVHTVSG